MRDPMMLCLEFMPTDASRDLGIEADHFVEDGKQFITTCVAYEHLSALSEGLYKHGYMLHDIEGNLAHVKVEKATGKESPEKPLVILSFVQRDKPTRHKINPMLN